MTHIQCNMKFLEFSVHNLANSSANEKGKQEGVFNLLERQTGIFPWLLLNIEAQPCLESRKQKQS